MARAGIAIGIGVAAAVAAAVVVTRRRARPAAESSDGNRWRTVTVLTDRREFDEPPAPLGELGDRIDWRVAPAPGDRGLELSVRLREPEPAGAASLVARASGDDDRQSVRRALRDAKSLLETGQVIRKEPQPAGRRNPTPQGALVDLVAARARGEGVL